MSNAKSRKPSLRTQLRNTKLRNTQLAVTELELKDELEAARKICDHASDFINYQKQQIHDLIMNLSNASRTIRSIDEQSNHQILNITMRGQAILGIIEKVATGKVTGQDIVILLTHLGTSVPDALIDAAKEAFKPLLMKLKAERQDQQGPLHVPALPPKKYGKIDERAHEDMVAEFSSNLIVGDAPDRTRYLLGCLSIECRTQVVEHLRNNMKLPAIKEVRSRTGCTLLEAKNTVETIQNMLEVLDRSPAAKKIAN